MAGLGRRSHYRKHLTDAVLNDLPEPTNSSERIAKVIGTRGSNQFELVVAPPTVVVRRVSKRRYYDNENKNSSSDNSSDNSSEKSNEEEEEYVDINNKVEDNDLDKTPQLSILPTKYRKLIWLKRNDYVICECAEVDDNDTEECEENGNFIDEDEHDTKKDTLIRDEGCDNNNDNNNNNNNNNNIQEEKQSSLSSSKNKNNNTIEGGIRFMITHILYKDQIKNLKEKKIWPMHSFFLDGAASNNNSSSSSCSNRKNNNSYNDQDGQENEENDDLIEKAKVLLKQEKKKYGNDGIIYEDDEEGYGNNDDDDEGCEHYDYSDNDGITFSNNNDYFVNTNRIAKLKIEDSSSEEDSD